MDDTAGVLPARDNAPRMVRYGDVKDGVVSAPRLVRKVFAERGWHEFPSTQVATSGSLPSRYAESATSNTSWSLYWKSGRFTVQEYKNWTGSQRMNHFPGSGIVCQKDSLARFMKRCRATYGQVYNFIPSSFILPTEYTKFLEEYARAQDLHGRHAVLWICKPSSLSRGRKIFLIRDIAHLVYDQQYVVQRYVERPLLIGNYKFDLRLYVLLLSVHPLAIYVSTEGLARFSTEQYSDKDTDVLADTDNLFAHLTNSSINKHNTVAWNADKDTVGHGAKWTLTMLREHFARNGLDWMTMWEKIRALIVLTLLPLPGHVPRTASPACFELLGFDVMIDADLRPWLIEVNTSPALSCDCHEDALVKEGLLHDVVDAAETDPFVEAARQEAVQDAKAMDGIPHSRRQPSSRPGTTPSSTRAAVSTAPPSSLSSPLSAKVTRAGSAADEMLDSMRQRAASARVVAREVGTSNVSMRVAARAQMQVRASSAASRGKTASGLPPRATVPGGSLTRSSTARPATKRDQLSSTITMPRRLSTAKTNMLNYTRKLRRNVGNLELIFPFNAATEELGTDLGLLSSGGASTIGGGEPVDVLKQLVAEVRSQWANPASGDKKLKRAASSRAQTEM